MKAVRRAGELGTRLGKQTTCQSDYTPKEGMVTIFATMYQLQFDGRHSHV